MSPNYIKAILVGVSLLMTAPVNAQDQDHRNDQQNNNRRYQDKAHNDSHEWNDQANQEYRRYLQDHHRKYHDFAKANTREQNDFWNWHHTHSGVDQR